MTLATRATTWLMLTVVVLLQAAAGNASASDGFLAENSCRGENALEGGFHRARASVSAETLRGCGEVCSGSAAGSAVAPKGTPPRTGRYGSLKSELPPGEQANHLNQNAAFRDIIPENEGLSHGLRGNAFTEPGTPHYEFHKSLEGFWNQFRKGGARFGQTPTNAEYGQALEQALRAGGLSPAEAADLAAQAAKQRAAYGLAGKDPVPRIPGRINQTPPP